ncbi:MAG: GIY-YIG nuclease family protein [Candidatus Margulisiibacteriota bacterium]
MFYVYILKSENNGKYYIGCTKDIEKRIREHNSGKTKSIKAFLPYSVAYKEEFTNFSEARKRERFIKAQKSRKYIDELINR